jgi:hypothetical protein
MVSKVLDMRYSDVEGQVWMMREFERLIENGPLEPVPNSLEELADSGIGHGAP